MKNGYINETMDNEMLWYELWMGNGEKAREEGKTED